MATEVISTIRSSGGDYTSLSAWEAGEQANLVTADQIRTAECYDDWPSGLNDAVTLSGWTVDSTRFAKITVASGHRHTGVPKSGFFIAKAGDFQYPYRSDNNYSLFEWLDVEYTGAAGNCYWFQGSNCKAVNCIGRSSNSGSTVFQCNSSTTLLIQCLAYNSPGSGFISNDYSNPTWLNCVAASCGTGFYASTAQARSPVAKNCVAYSNTTNYSATGWGAASTNNATSTGSDDAPGANSVISVSSSAFVNAASYDFHLASGSVLIGAGTNLYSDFTTDIDGDTWPSSGAWDIGFDYRVAGGGSYTLGTPTYVPGSITSSGFRPRIPVTVA